MAKPQVQYRCSECGYISVSKLGRCPECGAWGSFVEETSRPEVAERLSSRVPSATILPDETELEVAVENVQPERRMATGIEPWDEVLGGGLVVGSAVLVGGEPGIGKSTLVLQAAAALGRHGKVLYVSGEESRSQILGRVRRLGLNPDNLLLATTNSLADALALAERAKPAALVMDSLQSFSTEEDFFGSGTPAQLKINAAAIAGFSKKAGVAALIIGHVTKDGAIAGPKYVEHLVDAVLYMEGDRFGAYRLLRSGKNRYGKSGETGFFEMTSAGLVPILDPSSAFVTDVHNLQPGSVVVPAAQGSFAVLVEVQSLAATSYLPSPRRIATGLDYGRLMILLAVIERRAGTSAGGRDVYLNISGDFSVEDRGIDLGVGLSLYSAIRNVPIREGVMPIAEVGLAGDLRPVFNLHRRIELGARMGFREFVISDKARDDLSDLKGISIHRKRYLSDVIGSCFSGASDGGQGGQ
ncbi:MAG: DNA repair protein RadA [Candidatus Cryosericum sp.]